ncbi:MAG: polysaccharide biosynthesis/export family protein [Flavobacteriaceae bacterium]|nr:polysaccharide biosynthesis/export family protein [Flavobacteriaceae bacterium]MDZ4148969.1 polysaccharide biosynthesis/export family protein [Flavobacteriaceae bacterium]
MHLRNLLIFLFLISISSSCITTKQLTYLSEDDGFVNDSTHVYQTLKTPYKAQIGDVLSITVKTTDNNLAQLFNPTSNSESADSKGGGYFSGFSVDLHGNIRIPTLGEINVLGYTLEEIRIEIESLLLKDYFKTESSFFVTVKLSGFKFTVTGEVGSPGTKSLLQDQLNIIEALANSGEVSLTGDKRDIKIIRQYPEGQKIHSINLTKATAFQSPYFMLKPNDIIYVKPLKQKSLGTGTTAVQSLSTILTVLTLLTTTIILTTR